MSAESIEVATSKGLAPRGLLLALIGAACVVLFLVWWKTGQQQAAKETLISQFDAQIETDLEAEGEWVVMMNHDSLRDLTEVAPLMNRMGKVSVLDLSGSANLETLAGAETLSSLVSLIAIDCPSLKTTQGAGGLLKLRELIVQECPKLNQVGPLESLPSLVTLDLAGATGLTTLAIGAAPNLQGLTLSRADQLNSLDLTGATGLERLFLDGCRSLSQLSGLGQLSRLTDLDVSTCHGLTELDGLSQLTSLKLFDFRNATAWKDIGIVGSIPGLEVLRMGGREDVKDLTLLTGLTQLSELHVEACVNLQSLAGMPAAVSGYAAFTHCPKLLTLAGIESAKSLARVDLSGCEALADISALSALTALQEVNLGGCRGVTTVDVLTALPELQIVQLGGSGVSPTILRELQKQKPETIFDFSGGGEY